MNTNIRLAQLEKEAPLYIRVEKAMDTNPEYLQLSMESFFEKNFSQKGEEMPLSIQVQHFKTDPNFRLMFTLYETYFDRHGNDCCYSTDLYQLSSITDFKILEKMFYRDVGVPNFAGIISPEGVYYPAIKSHEMLCMWLTLKGIDIRGYVRTTSGLFSDLGDYVCMDKNLDFNLTEKQVIAMHTLFRLSTKDSANISFHNVIEKSYRLGLCKFSSKEKTQKEIKLFEDVLGEKIVDSREILSNKTRYY